MRHHRFHQPFRDSLPAVGFEDEHVAHPGERRAVRHDARVKPTEANRHLYDVLRAKGYSVRHVKFAGGHDYLNWRDTFGDALVFLMDGSRRAKLAKP